MLNWHRHWSMFSVEELFSLSYQLVASISLLHQLRERSLVTVDCRDAWIFCLEDKQRGLSTRYVLNGETVESRCNGQGASGLLQFTVFFLTSLEFLIFFVAVYVLKKRNVDSGRRERLLSKMASVSLISTGILTSILLLLPLMEYHVLSAANSAGGGVFDKILHSPIRVVVSCVIYLVTTPLRSILQAQYAVALDLTGTHPNFTCVDPSIEGGVQAKCPSTGTVYGASALAHMQAEPSTCKETFYCADDCDVAFPRIVISSLCVIIASFALCYRLLKLRHSGVGHEERTACVQRQAVGLEEPRCTTAVATNTHGKDYNDAATSTTLDYSTIMKGNAVAGARNSKLPAADYERQAFVELKRTEILDAGHGSQRSSRAKDSKSNVHDGASNGGNVHRQGKEAKGSRSKSGAGTRRPENGLVKRGKGRSSIREDTLERLEELQKHSSSSEELGDVVVVEEDGEYYMSGFRL